MISVFTASDSKGFCSFSGRGETERRVSLREAKSHREVVLGCGHCLGRKAQ